MNRFVLSGVTVVCAVALTGCGSSSKVNSGNQQVGTAATSTSASQTGTSAAAGSATTGSLPGAQSGSAGNIDSGSLNGGTTTTTTTTHTTTHTTTSAAKTTSTKATSTTKTKTVTKTITHTVTQVLTPGGVVSKGSVATVMRHIAAGMPAAAFPLVPNITVLGAFSVSGGNITCILYSDSVGCTIFHHDWRAPSSARNCGHTGTQFAVGGSDTTGVVCPASWLSYPRGNVVGNGTDVVSSNSNVVCQVRAAGVACFIWKGHGFTISRTGYLNY